MDAAGPDVVALIVDCGLKHQAINGQSILEVTGSVGVSCGQVVAGQNAGFLSTRARACVSVRMAQSALRIWGDVPQK